MKKEILLATICLMALTMHAQERSEAATQAQFRIKAMQAISQAAKKGIEEEGSRQERLSELETQEYVDLGLPSGTKWKTPNEINTADDKNGFYTYYEALSQFGNRLPTKEQWEELKDKCQWSWIGNGYKVTGPNDNSIILPAAGTRNYSGRLNGVGSHGYYWSSTPWKIDGAWHIFFILQSVEMKSFGRGYGRSVRLVQE